MKKSTTDKWHCYYLILHLREQLRYACPSFLATSFWTVVYSCHCLQIKAVEIAILNVKKHNDPKQITSRIKRIGAHKAEQLNHSPIIHQVKTLNF
ncbi:hypothetical protein ACDW34_11220 [Acinetobacter piscicola]|uniref:hypothetical protein n=1 Tax=Acinetobacter piscicola TaxID=2006115 RepID=UPI0010CFF53C|nr:hypothetical protein EWP19_06025 [Acinetobacter piscicola]